MLPNGRSAFKFPQHVRIPYDLIRSRKFRNLKGSSVKILLYLCTKHTGFNNRKIGCSCDELAKALGMSKATALAGLEELKKDGFIQCIKKGYFTGRKASEWEITFLSSEGYMPTNTWKDPDQRPSRPHLTPVKRDHFEQVLTETEDRF